MKMVDMVITKKKIFRPKIEKCQHFFQRPDFDNLALLVGLDASRPTYWGVWGAKPHRKKGSCILHVSVVRQKASRYAVMQHMHNLHAILRCTRHGCTAGVLQVIPSVELALRI